jgi:hypothetical protein
MAKIIRHIVSEMDENMIQRCIMCGEIIFDYSNAAWPAEQEPPRGFAPGQLFIQGKNPTSFFNELPDNENYEDCG